jgi:hypothetical protein
MASVDPKQEQEQSAACLSGQLETPEIHEKWPSAYPRVFQPFNYNDMRDVDVDILSENQLSDQINVFFDSIEKRLISYINSASYVIGCTAWFTNKNILEALKNKLGVKIIVNKEEYLSSLLDRGKYSFYVDLRATYNKIPDLFSEDFMKTENLTDAQTVQSFKKIFGEIRQEDHQKGSILTYGTINIKPKLHHKFLVFFDKEMKPMGVWTGSYNFTENSNFSLENALYITISSIVDKYIKEFLTVFPHSEYHDWKCGIVSKWKPNYDRYVKNK